MMTSLFRHSASSNGSHGSRANGNGGSELNNSKSSRQHVRRLEFNQAMDDFKTMFPSMDHEVIECVLRANNGAVDSTIDQLLQMSLDGQGTDDSSDSEDSIPPEILERTLEPDSSDEEAPPVYSPPSYEMHIYDRKHPADVPTFPPPRFEANPTTEQRQISGYRNWNPPLLGNLPDDFLRILPQQRDSLQCSQSSLSQPSSSSSSSLSSLTQCSASEQDRKLKQYLEDERIALFLQNEEFMRELQRNRDFLIALERDRQRYESLKSQRSHSSACMERSTEGDHNASGSEEACTSISDDALFRDKLKHMGKYHESDLAPVSSEPSASGDGGQPGYKEKAFDIAKSFSEKTRRKKTKKRALPKHHSLAPATSTANLLEDVEGLTAEDEGKLRRSSAQEKDESSKEVASW